MFNSTDYRFIPMQISMLSIRCLRIWNRRNSQQYRKSPRRLRKETTRWLRPESPSFSAATVLFCLPTSCWLSIVGQDISIRASLEWRKSEPEMKTSLLEWWAICYEINQTSITVLQIISWMKLSDQISFPKFISANRKLKFGSYVFDPIENSRKVLVQLRIILWIFYLMATNMNSTSLQ